MKHTMRRSSRYGVEMLTAIRENMNDANGYSRKERNDIDRAIRMLEFAPYLIDKASHLVAYVESGVACDYTKTAVKNLVTNYHSSVSHLG